MVSFSSMKIFMIKLDEGAIELVAIFSHWGRAVQVSDPDVHHDSWFMKTVEDKQRIAAICHFRNIHLYLVDVGDKHVSYMEYRCVLSSASVNGILF